MENDKKKFVLTEEELIRVSGGGPWTDSGDSICKTYLVWCRSCFFDDWEVTGDNNPPTQCPCCSSKDIEILETRDA